LVKKRAAASSKKGKGARGRKLTIPAASEHGDEDDVDGLRFDDVSGDEDRHDDTDDDDFERKAERFKKRLRLETAMAVQEQQDDATDRTAKATTLQDVDTEAEERRQAALLGVVPSHTTEELSDRIKETVRVLTNFAAEREDGRTREEYQTLLRSDLMTVFEYNGFLMDAVLDLFNPAEAVEFLEAMETQRPMTIRVNTIKSKRRDLVQTLTKKGVHVEPLEKWTKVGLQIFDSSVPVAGTTEYLAGHYMLQSAVSFLPVMALGPLEGERILDMSAAPGGKTTFIAQLMKNTGVLFANDVSEPRCKSLNANLQRLGVTNCIVTNYDGTGYEKVMKNFDRVLLDAPCTGTGIISRDKSIKLNKLREDVQRHGQLQRRLLLSAIDCCRPGGVVVYSTCSFMVDEDEAVVDFAVAHRDVVVEDMGLPFGRPGLVKFRHHRFHGSLELSRRYFPHVHNMDGFYVCRLRKRGDDRRPTAEPRPSAGRPAAASSTRMEVPVPRKTAAPGPLGSPAAEAKVLATASTLRLSIPPKPTKDASKKKPAAKRAAVAGGPKKARKTM
jgi:ribosomal RNA methyltransferase Nop2